MRKDKTNPGVDPLMSQAWWPLWLFLLLLAGAGVGYCFLLRPGPDHNSPFQEVVWEPREVARSIVDAALAERSAALTRFPAADTVLETAWSLRAEADRQRFRNRLASLQGLREFRRRLDLPDPALDSQLAKSLHVFTADAVLPGMGQQMMPGHWEGGRLLTTGDGYYADPPIAVALAGAGLPDSLVLKEYRPPVRSYRFSSLFFNRYPAFGLWVLLLLIQLCFFGGVLLVVSFAVYGQPRPALRAAGVRLPWYLQLIFTLCVATLLLFLYLFFISNEKVDLLPSVLFMMGSDKAFAAANLPGYAIALVCIVGFMSCGSAALQLRRRVEEEPGEEALAKIRKATACLESTFRMVFVVLGLLLSLGVFSTAVYFQGLNDLDFVKQLSRQLGHLAIRQEWVLLYGLAHSLLILLFYLPVRFMLDGLPKPEQDGDEAVKSNGLSGVLAAPLKSLLNGLIATSPLIAGLLQSVLEKLLS